LGRRPLGAILHSSNEPGELSQWLCHDDSTINIVVLIIIIIIIIMVVEEFVYLGSLIHSSTADVNTSLQFLKIYIGYQRVSE